MEVVSPSLELGLGCGMKVGKEGPSSFLSGDCAIDGQRPICFTR